MPQLRFNRTPGYLLYILIILLMVGCLLSWQAWKRTDNFIHYHRQLAITSVKGATDELEIMMNELQRSMRLFASDNRSLFYRILADSDDDTPWEELEEAVQNHFPEFFGMTLTDTAGNVLRPDYDNYVVDLCRKDIRAFIDQGYRQQGYIHPNPLGYHFDIMTPWGRAESPEGVFFLSFHPDKLVHILKRQQSPGHELMLLKREKPGFIEVTSHGTRDTLQRDFFLDTGELDRISYSLPVINTHWNLVDIPSENLFYREAARNWMYAAIVFGVFISITLLMLYQLYRKEKLCIQAEEQALQHQNDLAHLDRLNILGEMASGIAHELNQPLTAISAYCQSGLRILDTDGDRSDKLARILEESSLQAKRAGNIIHRMRQFATKGTLRRAAVDINHVISDAARFIRPELDKHGITLDLDLANELPPVTADSIQIEQVILNLMHNAIEAMNETANGTRKLVVSSQRMDEKHIKVRVQDNGPGLEPGTVDRLFDTFYSTKSDGMGLGLSISRSIIEVHGGQLWTAGDQGTGATFCFSLPLSDKT